MDMIPRLCNKNPWVAALLAAAGLAMHGMASSFTVPAPEHPYRPVEFAWRRPAGTKAATGVLLLVPGFNGSGQAMRDGLWAQFADECGLLRLNKNVSPEP